MVIVTAFLLSFATSFVFVFYIVHYFTSFTLFPFSFYFHCFPLLCSTTFYTSAFAMLMPLCLSSKVLIASLVTVSGLIFLIKLKVYNSVGDANLRFHDINVPILQLIPSSTFFHPWVVVTAIFAETSVVMFAVSLAVLYGGGKFIEKFWLPTQVIQFVLIVGAVTNLVTVLLTIVANLFTSNSAGMDVPLGGGISYYFGFLVVLKQLIPEHNIVLFQGLINCRVKHLPFVSLIIVSLWSLLISRSLYPAVPSLNSFFISFIFLRFYQSSTTDLILPLSSNDSPNILVGDASDTFQLVEFFPAITKPYLAVVFSAIYEAAVFLGIVTPFNDDSIEQSNLRAQKRQEISNHPHKATANSVAERRRQVALQVIEDRINQDSK